MNAPTAFDLEKMAGHQQLPSMRKHTMRKRLFPEDTIPDPTPMRASKKSNISSYCFSTLEADRKEQVDGRCCWSEQEVHRGMTMAKLPTVFKNTLLEELVGQPAQKDARKIFQDDFVPEPSPLRVFKRFPVCASSSTWEEREQDKNDRPSCPSEQEVHRDMMAAKFKIGITRAAPSTVMECMQLSPSELTSERIKSRLQKFRIARVREQETFLRDYDEFLLCAGDPSGPPVPAPPGPRARGTSATVMPRGQAAAIVTQSVMNKDRNKAHHQSDNSMSSANNNVNMDCSATKNKPCLVFPTGTDEFPFPKLTEEERKSTLGKSLLWAKGMIDRLNSSNLVVEQHHAQKSVGDIQQRSDPKQSEPVAMPQQSSSSTTTTTTTTTRSGYFTASELSWNETSHNSAIVVTNELQFLKKNETATQRYAPRPHLPQEAAGCSYKRVTQRSKRNNICLLLATYCTISLHTLLFVNSSSHFGWPVVGAPRPQRYDHLAAYSKHYYLTHHQRGIHDEQNERAVHSYIVCS